MRELNREDLMNILLGCTILGTGAAEAWRKEFRMSMKRWQQEKGSVW